MRFHRGSMRLRRGYVFTGALLAAVAVLPVLASSGALQTVDAVNEGTYTHLWSPSHISVATGGEVTMRNATTTRHGVYWFSVPATPTCEPAVPVGTTEAASGTEWSGNCKFTQPGTYTYYCTVHGSAMSGTVTVATPGAPTATTGVASAVTETGATLNGTVDPEGKPTTYYFNYGTTASYGLKTPEEPAGEESAQKAVSAPVSGLALGTTYHYQLVAKNGAATTPGADHTFTTLSPPGPPSAVTGTASAIGETSATLKGTVNPDGLPTKYFFEWGLATSYEQLTSEVATSEDHIDHAVSVALTGLAPGTVYHYRLVASNGSGPSTGADQAFTTSEPSPPPTTTTTTTTTPQTTPPPTSTQSTPPPSTEAPPAGPALIASTLKLAAPRHGASVRGSLQLGASGAGGSLQVDVLAKSSSLVKSRGSGSKLVRIGRFSRQAVSTGKLSFSVALSAQAKRVLARRHKLAVTVKIVLTPPLGHASTITRAVTLRA